VPVPGFDLSRAVDEIRAAVEERWSRILETTSFVLGPEVGEFEGAFAAYLGAAACVGVANGTDALTLALRALGTGPGDEVIVPAFSFFATVEAVVLVGARPVFADVEPETLNLDARDAAGRISERTVGVIGVHLYGQPFDVEGVSELCQHRGLWLVEDAAQAHGAEWRGRRVGTYGSLAAWSFYPSKNLGCFGDGGAVTGNDEELLARVRCLANHGQVGRYRHARVGVNSRLDSLQAAVLNCRLPRLDADNERRRAIAGRYREAMDGLADLALLVDREETYSVYHQFTVRAARRDALQEQLAARGVGSSVHYPTPLYGQPAVAARERIPELPVAAVAAREVLSLPMFPQLTDAEVEEVCSATRRFSLDDLE
jgi:dTDP-4-amino-4,6-dideoxygalactose transaminase